MNICMNDGASVDVPITSSDLVQDAITHVVPFVLVFFRILGVFIVAPMLSSTAVPVRARLLLGFIMSVAIYPAVAGKLVMPAETDLFGLLPLVLGEALIGFSIGLMMALPLMALEGAGVIAGHQMGMSLARVYNPELDTEADLLGQLLFFAAFASFLLVGGMEAIFGATISTFERVPLGGIMASKVPLESLVGLVSSGLELSVRVAAPVTGVILLLAITLGALSKTMPQINVMSVGFALKIMAGVLMLAFGTSSAVSAVIDSMDDAGKEVARFIATL